MPDKSIIGAMGNLVCEKLSEAKLKRLSNHKYSATGSTLLDPIMQKFWKWFLTNCIPLWWAPNAMTLFGLVVNLFTCSILVWYSPNAINDIPSWALILAAFGLFIYQTLDACDGKQARRTQTSSSLGELFDHGCDAVSTIFISLSVCLSAKMGYYANWIVVLCAGATSLFYTAHWQAYVSGTLKFDRFDVTEAQFTVITIHVLSAIFGLDIWSTKLFGIELKLIPMIFTVLNEIRMLVRDLGQILSGGAGKNGSTIAGTSILSPIIPLLSVFTLTLLIYSRSASNVFVEYVALYIITFGFVSAKITCKLVVAHMSKSEMAKMDTIFIGPLILFFNQYFNTYFNEYYMLWIAFAYILLDFTLFCYSTCHQLASYLNIYVLTIKTKPVNDASGASTSSLNNTGSNTTTTNGREHQGITTRNRGRR